MIDDGAFRLLKKMIPGSYTFIFEAQKKITKHLKASKTDKEVGKMTMATAGPTGKNSRPELIRSGRTTYLQSGTLLRSVAIWS